MYGEDEAEDRFGIQPYWEIPRSSLQYDHIISVIIVTELVDDVYRGHHTSTLDLTHLHMEHVYPDEEGNPSRQFQDHTRGPGLEPS